MRAATTGAINFDRFDPDDPWWWKQLEWILLELQRKSSREVLAAQQAHYGALLANSSLKSDSWEEVQQQAKVILNHQVRRLQPWRTDLEELDPKTERDQLVQAYEETYGKPGEPRYEAMVAELRRAFAENKKKTPLQRMRERQQQGS